MLQDAISKLIQVSQLGPLHTSQQKMRVSATLAKALSLFVPAKGANAVHPSSEWQGQDSFESFSSEEDDSEVPQGLVAAAMYLLHDSTLADPDAGPPTTPGTLSRGQLPINWEELVGRQLQTQSSVAASSRLLAMRNAVPSPSARMVFQSQASLQISSALSISPSFCIS